VSSLEKFEESHSRPSRDFSSLLVFFCDFVPLILAAKSLQKKREMSKLLLSACNPIYRAYCTVLFCTLQKKSDGVGEGIFFKACSF